MAWKKKTPRQPDPKETPVDEFATFALEEAEDNKFFKFSVWTAVGVHMLLLLINFPAFTSKPLEAEEKDKKVFIVQTPRFKPPPPPTEKPMVKRTKRMPMPDPTPDDPEPLRVDETKYQVDIPQDTDFDFDIPDAPPPIDEGPVGPRQVGGDVTEPIRLHAPQPQYTEIARRARIQGTVIVQAIIDEEGNVTNVKVLKTLPMGLGEAASEAIKGWKFKPATLNGKPVDVYYTLTVTFSLQ